jgi:ribonuclease Z
MEEAHMKLTVLGSGTPTPSLKRQSSGYVVEIGADTIVLDHGPGAHHRFLEAGKNPDDITHVLFSHLHYDHWMDYPRLVLQRWDMGAGMIPDLKVFGPPPLTEKTELLFGTEGVFGPDIEARIRHQGSIDIYEARGGIAPRERPNPEVTNVFPGDEIKGSDWVATVGEASHVQPYLECYGYRIETDSAVLCYSGDSGGVSESIISLATGADVLIHMNHFRSGTEPTAIYREVCGNHIDTAKVARAAGVKTLVVSHMLEQIDQPGIREEILREMMAIFDGHIIWAEDLMEIPIHGPTMAVMD